VPNTPTTRCGGVDVWLWVGVHRRLEHAGLLVIIPDRGEHDPLLPGPVRQKASLRLSARDREVLQSGETRVAWGAPAAPWDSVVKVVDVAEEVARPEAVDALHPGALLHGDGEIAELVGVGGVPPPVATIFRLSESPRGTAVSLREGSDWCAYVCMYVRTLGVQT
jgi:hypothetical protein